MVEQRDLGIMVAGATRLNDCWRELGELFAQYPVKAGEDALWARRFAIYPPDIGAVHKSNSEDVAVVELRRAIQDGKLPLWIRRSDGEAQVDKYAIRSEDLNHRTFGSGVYINVNYPHTALSDFPLWVKNEDWARFKTAIVIQRYGHLIGLGAPDRSADPGPGKFEPAYPNVGDRVYNWPIWDVISRLGQFLGEDEQADCFPETRKAMRQAALDGRILIFGKRELPAPRTGFCSDVWTLIPPEYWQSHLLNPMATGVLWFGHDHTAAEVHSASVPKDRYWSLLLNPEEVYSKWPLQVHETEAPALTTMSHDDVVNWCRNWIAEGRGNGMDKAWLVFKTLPARRGLSRDDNFRPAWLEAKTKAI